ncbi:hypothetical protein [Streptomyces scopuliridis]|uniref:hypothetical protein n=1 Tax=Streptomyces scopuliridis TaxID=452529 RepID=UPI0036A44314
MSIQLPPLPSDVPTLIETSFSHHQGPAAHGIDIDTQWWCETDRRPRYGDATAHVSAPGTGLYQPLLSLTLWADDLDETEAVGHYAIRITRPLLRLVADRSDAEAMEELKTLLAPSGPLGNRSQGAWRRVLEWLPEAAEASQISDIPTLELSGQGGPVELWTVSMVAKYLGFTGDSANGSARKQLSRWGLKSEGREPGRRGESQYAADQVKAAHANRPGRGRWAESRNAEGA